MTLASHPLFDEARCNEFTAKATLIQKVTQALESVEQVTEFTDGMIAIDFFSKEWRELLKLELSDMQLLSSEREHANRETHSEGLHDVLDAVVLRFPHASASFLKKCC